MAHGQDDHAAEPDEIHVSPDGALTLVVFLGDDPMLGFDGLAWHVHGASYPAQGAPQAVVATWVADILSGARPIIECWKDGVRVDAWTPQDNAFDFARFVEESKDSSDPAEEWCLRRWAD